MAKIRRVVRKAPPPAGPFFDEQLWPVAIALVVLGGFLIGVSLAYQPLSGVAWHRTAWPSLVGIPLVVAGAIAALVRIESLTFRRSLQLSLVVCAIFHVALIVQMIETRMFAGLFLAAVQPAKKEIFERRPLKVVPEYHPTLLVPEESRPRQDFEKPVETQSPEPTREPEKIVRQPLEEDRSPQVQQPVPVIEQQRTTEPNVVSRNRANEAAPRLASQTSRLSRQVTPSEQRTSQSVETPLAALPTTATADLQPAASEVTRQRADSAIVSRSQVEPVVNSKSHASSLARRNDEQAPDAASVRESSSTRAIAQPIVAPPSQVVSAATSSTPPQSLQTPLEPASTPAARTLAQSASPARRTAEPTAEANRSATSQPPRRATETAERPAVVSAESQKAARKQPAATPRTTTAAAMPAADRNTAAQASTVAVATPAAAALQRSAAGASAAQLSATRPEAAPTAAGNPSAAKITRAAVDESAFQTFEPQAAPGISPKRAVAVAAEASSPTAIDSPAAAIAQAADAAAEPSQMALSRAQGGIVGTGRSPNVESSSPGGASPALVASGAFQRAESIQRSPAGAALSPSAASQLARSRAEAQIATAPLRAQPLDIAGVAGATQVAEVTASSSASLTRSQSNVKSGALTAAKGTSQIDLGPTQRVSEAGVGRAASGGGQADLSHAPPTPQLARQRVAGGEPQMSLAKAAAGEVAASAGDTGGTPPSSEPAATAVATTRGTPGGSIADRNAIVPANAGPAGGEAKNIVAPAAFSRAAAENEASIALPAVAAGQNERNPVARAVAGGPAMAADVAAQQIAPSAGASSNSAAAAPLAASDVMPSRQVPGSSRPEAPSGALAASDIGGKTPGAVVAGTPTRREIPGADADEPRAASDRVNGSVARRASPAGDAAAPTNVAAIPEVGPRSAVAQAEIDHLFSGGVGQSPMARRNDDALSIDVRAIAGPGGLGADYTPEVGINTRQARADSLNVQLRSARFVRTHVGGVPAVSTSAIVSSEAFSSRGARASGDLPAGGRGSPEPQTEEAIERGLAFLARYQLPDGGWSLQGFPEGAQLASDTAATALAIIAFQGAGYHHREFQYKDVVRGGIDALLNGQKASGDLFVPLDDASNRSVWLYSHSLAAIALCEAYGMTQDPALREPAQKAINFIAVAQQTERGGWRYSPGTGADTSVSGWMMMALKSGELAGLNVPAGTYDKINRWLDDAQQSPSEPHLYRYNPYAPDSPEQRHGRTASKTMTAVGLLMRLYSGWKRDNPSMLRGAAFLAENLPALGTTREPERDTYYWYYATQVMAHMGGDHWQTWFARLHPLLIDAQVRQGAYAGSWDPVAPLPDRWGPHAGRIYVTTMNLLSLEVQYRKLPLYDSAIR